MASKTMGNHSMRKVNTKDGEGRGPDGSLLHIPLLNKSLLEFEAGVQAMMIHMVADGHGWSAEKLYEAIGVELGVTSNLKKIRQLREQILEALSRLEQADVEA